MLGPVGNAAFYGFYQGNEIRLDVTTNTKPPKYLLAGVMCYSPTNDTGVAVYSVKGELSILFCRPMGVR